MLHFCVAEMGHCWLRYKLVACSTPDHYLSQRRLLFNPNLTYRLQWQNIAFGKYSLTKLNIESQFEVLSPLCWVNTSLTKTNSVGDGDPHNIIFITHVHGYPGVGFLFCWATTSMMPVGVSIAIYSQRRPVIFWEDTALGNCFSKQEVPWIWDENSLRYHK